MTVKLLTEHHLEFLSLKGGCTGSSESKCHIVGNLMSQLKCCLSCIIDGMLDFTFLLIQFCIPDTHKEIPPNSLFSVLKGATTWKLGYRP